MFLRDFWGWQSPAGTSPEQPQIATMKEKPSYHPKRESRALQTCFRGIEERSIKYESDPQTVNFISVLSLIQWNQGTGEISLEISQCQIFRSSIRSSNRRTFAFTTSLEMKLLWLSTWCPIRVNLVSMDRGHIGLHYDRRDLKVNESFGVALLEPSRSIRCFLRFLQNLWQRGSETSGLAMLLVRACGAETFVPWTLLERAGVQRQNASCLFMLELNFHSGSSFTQVSDVREMDDVTVWQIAHVCISFVSRVRRLSACGCVTLLPPPKLQAISPRVFVIGDYVLHLVCFPVFGSVDHFRDVSVWTADIETLGAIYIDCGVPVMLGGPIGSETR
uniref:Uncharacterized protein n=1 Tax=Brassica oleracea var. oleracea TaxID=109376 RepID=A0A0D3APX9_BRAOL